MNDDVAAVLAESHRLLAQADEMQAAHEEWQRTRASRPDIVLRPTPVPPDPPREWLSADERQHVKASITRSMKDQPMRTQGGGARLKTTLQHAIGRVVAHERDLARRHVADAMKGITERCDQLEQRVRDIELLRDAQAEVNKLRDEIGSLRAELAAVKGAAPRAAPVLDLRPTPRGVA